jgi:membrane protein implicated in regulation of membrane protease activity
MIDLFWGCLYGGILFALASLLGGRSLHRTHGLHGAIRFRGLRFLHPLTIVGSVTAFGGAGILLVRYAALSDTMLVALAAAIALLFSVAIHFGYVRPMARSETSIGFSKNDYVGRTALVTVPIREMTRGQVMIRMGAGNTCEPAASFDGDAIPSGSQVVVIEVRDHILYVSPADH